MDLPEKVKETITTMQKAGFECFAVGGSVRDLLLSRPTKMWDFATNALPEQIQQIFPDSFYNNNFGTVGIKIKDDKGELLEIFEITPYRKEGIYSDLRHPDKIEWATTLKEDLARRDFTINAIAITLAVIASEAKQSVPQHKKQIASSFTPRNDTVVVDPFNGQEDLKNKLIRAVGNPADRFAEDGLRLMRAIRIATQLRFLIEENTWRALTTNSELLTKISSERIRDELIKILSSDYPADGVHLLYTSGLLEYILPELTKGVGMKQPGHHISDVFTHSVDSLRSCKNPNWLVRFATLIHDIGKPTTYRDRGGKPTFYSHDSVGATIARHVADRLHFRKEEREKLYMLVRWHMFSVSELLTDAAIRRFIRRIGPENTAEMLDLRIADRLGSGAKQTSWRLEEFKKRIIQVQQHIPSVKDLKVNGRDVMAVLGIPPSRQVGEILDKLFEEIMDDPKKNEREYLLKRIKEVS